MTSKNRKTPIPERRAVSSSLARNRGFFGGFGAAHGACLAVALWLVQAQPAWGQAWGGVLGLGALSLVLCTAVPVLGFMQASLRRHGHAGVRPVHAASSSSTQAEARDARRPQ